METAVGRVLLAGDMGGRSFVADLRLSAATTAPFDPDDGKNSTV